MKALRAIGIRAAMRFLWFSLLEQAMYLCVLPQLRVLLLRLAGAKVGPGTVVMRCRFANVYRRGFAGLTLGRDCFVGDECLLDLADGIYLGDRVTLAFRVTILTHLNVGYPDHPLQSAFPSDQKSVTIWSGSFIGTGATIFPGVSVGPQSLVGAGALVLRSSGERSLLTGVPAKLRRSL